MISATLSGEMTTAVMTMMNFISSSTHHDDANEEYDNSTNIDVYTFNNPKDFEEMFPRQMQEMFRAFGQLFGDITPDFPNDHTWHNRDLITPGNENKDIRSEYLKPGFQRKELNSGSSNDADLDGKISSMDISGFLKNKNDSDANDGTLTNSQPSSNSCTFFQTVITSSITKPDGTTETRCIVKDHTGTIEETVTTTNNNPGSMDQPDFPQSASVNAMKSFLSLWRMF